MLTPPLAQRIEHWPLAKLIPYARNPRTHSDAQVAQIAASITAFGFNAPIAVDTEAGIICGHGRWLAARKLGLTHVPVIVLDHLTDAQKRAYIISDNQLALNAGWNDTLLAAELAALQQEDFDVGLIGFEDEELARLLAAQEATEGLCDEDAAPPAPQTPTSQLGDLWLLGPHRLLCGDSTNQETVSRVLSSVKPTLLVTDQPYGVQYDPEWRKRAGVNNSNRMGKVRNDDRSDWREAWALFPGDVAYVWHGALHASTVSDSLESCGFEIRSQIVWAKPSLVARIRRAYGSTRAQQRFTNTRSVPHGTRTARSGARRKRRTSSPSRLRLPGSAYLPKLSRQRPGRLYCARR